MFIYSQLNEVKCDNNDYCWMFRWNNVIVWRRLMLMLLRNVGIDRFCLQGCAPPLITQAGHVFRQRGYCRSCCTACTLSSLRRSFSHDLACNVCLLNSVLSENGCILLHCPLCIVLIFFLFLHRTGRFAIATGRCGNYIALWPNATALVRQR